MKIYVITMGEYSDYHICGVTDDRDKAENLVRIFNRRRWENARIEEFDTDSLVPMLESETPFRVLFFENGDVQRVIDQTIDYFESGIRVLRPEYWSGATLEVSLLAKDENSAIKIAAEKRAKFLAENNGLL